MAEQEYIHGATGETTPPDQSRTLGQDIPLNKDGDQLQPPVDNGKKGERAGIDFSVGESRCA